MILNGNYKINATIAFLLIQFLHLHASSFIFILATRYCYFCTCFFLVRPACGSDRDDCDPGLSTCNDLELGNYECTCDKGYVGNGKKCIG